MIMNKKIISTVVIVSMVFCFSSCSITFEKRRYRQGYHVEIVKNHHRSSVIHKKDSVLVKKNEITPVALYEEMNAIIHAPVYFSTKKNNLLEKNKEAKIMKPKSPSIPIYWDNLKPKKFFKKAFYKPDDVKVRSKLGLIFGLIFGGISLILLIVGLIALSGGGWGGLSIAVFAFMGCIIALIIALVLGLIKWKAPEDYTPVSPKHIQAGFVMSIISAGLGLLSLIFSFLIYPFGWIAIGVASAALLLGIISFSFGFRSLPTDKSLKTKLTIILGFLALLFLILAMIFLFV